MKKPQNLFVLFLIPAILSVLLLTACEDDDVRLTRMDDGENPAQMAFRLVNRTGRKITLGHPLLYMKAEDTWEKVPYVTEPNWSMIYDELGPLGYATVTIPVEDRYGELAEGEYQVRLDYTPIHFVTEDTGRHTAVCVFSVP